jgi:hypothetical protein
MDLSTRVDNFSPRLVLFVWQIFAGLHFSLGGKKVHGESVAESGLVMRQSGGSPFGPFEVAAHRRLVNTSAPRPHGADGLARRHRRRTGLCAGIDNDAADTIRERPTPDSGVGDFSNRAAESLGFSLHYAAPIYVSAEESIRLRATAPIPKQCNSGPRLPPSFVFCPPTRDSAAFTQSLYSMTSRPRSLSVTHRRPRWSLKTSLVSGAATPSPGFGIK